MSKKIKRCRKCGCTDDNACQHFESGQTCFWVQDDLCFACVAPEVRRQYRRPSGPIKKEVA
jgi:hypothetical protein